MNKTLPLGLLWTIRLNVLCAILPVVRYIFLTPSARGTPMFQWQDKYFFALDSLFLIWLSFGLMERRAWARWTALVFYCGDALGARLLGFLWPQQGADWMIFGQSYSVFTFLAFLVQVATPPMMLFIIAYLLSHSEDFKN